VQVTLGLILLATDHRAGDELHYVYGVSLLVVTVVTEGMRAGAAQRELEGIEDVAALSASSSARLRTASFCARWA